MPSEQKAEGDRFVTGDKVSDAAIKHLQDPQTANNRFFMWVHYLDPHAEYVVHEGFDFGSDQRAAYDSEVAFTDHQVGRVLEALAKSPFKDRTVVILTSDHGEAFGEHGMNRHGFELWDVLIRVPLLIAVPGLEPARHDERRSLIDLAPTVLELFGLPLPADDGRDFLSGTSLVPDLLTPNGKAISRRPIFVDLPESPFVPERQAFIENDLKLITSRSRPMGLYDLANDPDENQNLVRDVERTKVALERMKAFRRGLRRAR
jgi:arylsulfatase A-like enzyme